MIPVILTEENLQAMAAGQTVRIGLPGRLTAFFAVGRRPYVSEGRHTVTAVITRALLDRLFDEPQSIAFLLVAAPAQVRVA